MKRLRQIESRRMKCEGTDHFGTSRNARIFELSGEKDLRRNANCLLGLICLAGAMVAQVLAGAD
jgi:hypothetical protein